MARSVHCLSSASSSTRNRGSTPAASKFCLSTDVQNECSVEIDALSSRSACSRARASPCAARSENRLRSFSRMSALAARVKVTISISSTFAPSSTSRLTRSTSTLVLPEPAAAATSRLVPRASIAPA